MDINVHHEIIDQEEDTLKDKFLIFSLGNEFYGLEIRYVIEIIGLQPITGIPELPQYMKGIINLRGQIIPVMDARLRFKKPFKEYNDRTCIIVVNIQDVFVGLIVDSVSEVMTISNEHIVAPPDMGEKGNKYIKGIGKVGNSMILLLDCNKLVKLDEVEMLTRDL